VRMDLRSIGDATNRMLALAVQRETRTIPIVFAARTPSPPRRATRPAEWEDRFSPGHRVSYAEFIGIYRISHRSSFGSHGKHRRCQETQERVGFGGAIRQDRLEHNAPDWPLPAGPGPGQARRGCLAVPRSGRGTSVPMLPLRPCLPTFAPFPPSGPDWLHEIKHDGYRMLALRDGDRVRLISRSRVDWTCGFPMIVAAVQALAARSCLIDGEVITCDGDGLADFQLLRRRQNTDPAILCAFDLLGVDGRDLRDEPLEERKAELARMLVDSRPAVAASSRTRARSSLSTRASSDARVL